MNHCATLVHKRMVKQEKERLKAVRTSNRLLDFPIDDTNIQSINHGRRNTSSEPESSPERELRKGSRTYTSTSDRRATSARQRPSRIGPPRMRLGSKRRDTPEPPRPRTAAYPHLSAAVATRSNVGTAGGSWAEGRGSLRVAQDAASATTPTGTFNLTSTGCQGCPRNMCISSRNGAPTPNPPATVQNGTRPAAGNNSGIERRPEGGARAGRSGGLRIPTMQIPELEVEEGFVLTLTSTWAYKRKPNDEKDN